MKQLLAEMNAMEERTDANLREAKAEIRTNREEMKTDEEDDGKAGREDRGQ
jgi:hypothetical protein